MFRPKTLCFDADSHGTWYQVKPLSNRKLLAASLQVQAVPNVTNKQRLQSRVSLSTRTGTIQTNPKMGEVRFPKEATRSRLLLSLGDVPKTPNSSSSERLIQILVDRYIRSHAHSLRHKKSRRNSLTLNRRVKHAGCDLPCCS